MGLKVKCTDILLNIVRDGPCAALAWNEVQTKGDFNIAFKLLSIGDATVKARACATIKSLCTPKIPGQAPRVSTNNINSICTIARAKKTEDFCIGNYQINSRRDG